jgi:putative SOS response-associated peptidase YedK
MCGRYYRTADKQQLAEALRADPTGDSLLYAPGYNITPSTTQPVLRQTRESNQREIVPMRWGLVGFGSSGIDPKRSTFNARAEGLQQSSLWKRPLHRQRCIVPVSGYYEWRKSDKAAFRFTVSDEPVFGLAGLWDAWKSPEGHWLQSFTIITTDPSTAAEPIHNRMPAILRPKDYNEWLDREEVERPPIHLLRPFESNEMHIHNAHPKVGNVRNQGPEMLNSQ